MVYVLHKERGGFLVSIIDRQRRRAETMTRIKCETLQMAHIISATKIARIYQNDCGFYFQLVICKDGGKKIYNSAAYYKTLSDALQGSEKAAADL